MSLGEFAAFVCSHLQDCGIECVLSGGACVSIYTTNRYESFDLDFIENISTSRKKLKDILEKLGFFEEQRYFKHPDTDYFVEFPSGPLSVGDEPVRETVTMEFSTGQLRLISPTDCIKDRLACFYHWNDRQCLEQALLVAESVKVDLKEIERWSRNEGKIREFELVRPDFEKSQSIANRSD